MTPPPLRCVYLCLVHPLGVLGQLVLVQRQEADVEGRHTPAATATTAAATALVAARAASHGVVADLGDHGCTLGLVHLPHLCKVTVVTQQRYN